ncbi:MAG: hypothetical protein ACM3O4_04535 [Ignavibacteriales bacterium]
MVELFKKYYRKNEALVIFIVPLFFSLVFLIAKFITFIINRGYFDYYSIDIAFYQSNFNIEISNLIINSVMSIIFLLSVIFFYKSLKIEQIKKDKIWDTIILFTILFLINIIILFLFFKTWNSLGTIFIGFIYTAYQFTIAFLFYKDRKKEKTRVANGNIRTLAVSQNYIFIRIFLVIVAVSIAIGAFYKMGAYKAEIKKYFYTSNNEVILYMNNDYAIVSKYDTDDNGEIIIYTYKQKKIDINNVELTYIKYKKVIISSNNE